MAVKSIELISITYNKSSNEVVLDTSVTFFDLGGRVRFFDYLNGNPGFICKELATKRSKKTKITCNFAMLSRLVRAADVFLDLPNEPFKLSIIENGKVTNPNKKVTYRMNNLSEEERFILDQLRPYLN